MTIWLAPHQKTQIPVTCLEHGRWDRSTGDRFEAGPKADLHMRRMLSNQVHASARQSAPYEDAPAPMRYAADQGEVWNEVDRKHQRAASSSRTGALHDLYAREASDVEALERAFPYPDGATGAAKPPRPRYPDREALARMLGRVKQAQDGALVADSVGVGTDLRFESDKVTGSALLWDEGVVHAEVHRVA